jgi:hypothetical protein
VASPLMYDLSKRSAQTNHIVDCACFSRLPHTNASLHSSPAILFASFIPVGNRSLQNICPLAASVLSQDLYLCSTHQRGLVYLASTLWDCTVSDHHTGLPHSGAPNIAGHMGY